MVMAFPFPSALLPRRGGSATVAATILLFVLAIFEPCAAAESCMNEELAPLHAADASPYPYRTEQVFHMHEALSGPNSGTIPE